MECGPCGWCHLVWEAGHIGRSVSGDFSRRNKVISSLPGISRIQGFGTRLVLAVAWEGRNSLALRLFLDQ